jgi:signal transduction histidine kinase/CheY-like chemotaxis protein
LLHPEDVAATRRALMRSFRGMTPWYHEFRIKDVQAAGWRWVRGHAIPQPGPVSGSVLWNGILIDITDRKSLEDDLRQAQRIESVGRLAGGVAHDFNNLLTVILGQTEMLAMELPPSSGAAEGVRQIRSAAQSGSALTRQLLGFARKQMVEPRVIDVNALVQRVPPLVGRLFGQSITFVLQLAPTPPRVHVDPAQFDQVLVNLVVNACDAMPDGGLLEIRTREVSNAEALSKPEYAIVPGPIAEICVRDTGVGMSADVRGRAFEPFFTTKGLGKGTGLGLATSHGIVSQAGGTIIIESVEGNGTTVRVLLPVTQETTSAPDEPASVSDDAGSETVLVVDDNDAVRGVTAAALRRKGYRVLQADSGAAAIAASRREQGTIHLLVTDVAMPHMSGPVLADRLSRERPDMRVLFVTGYADGAIAQYGAPIDGAALLQKPYDIGSLARRVRELLEEAPRAAT